jgi:hypothetical protein
LARDFLRYGMDGSGRSQDAPADWVPVHATGPHAIFQQRAAKLNPRLARGHHAPIREMRGASDRAEQALEIDPWNDTPLRRFSSSQARGGRILAA